MKRESHSSGEEHSDHSDQSRKPAVARDKVVCQNGDKPLPRGINDPAADNSAGIAAKAHAHG